MSGYVQGLAFLILLGAGALGLVVLSSADDESDRTSALVILGVAVVIGVGLLALASRLDTRPCPRCGRRIDVGDVECPHCGFFVKAPDRGSTEQTAQPTAQEVDAPSVPASGDRVEKLRVLAELHESGALSNEEFASEKARVLGDTD